MKNHEYANIFPMMTDDELSSLVEDIKTNGQSEPIVMLEGKILDGRNRYRACEIAGVSAKFRQFTGSDPLGFVISHNLHRRHLTESQRAMVAAKWAGLKHGGTGANQYKRAESPIGDSAKQSETKTRDEAAKLLSVGTSSIDRAKKVIKGGISLLQDMVQCGDVSISAASEVAKMDKDKQIEIVSGGAAAVKKAAKKSKESREPLRARSEKYSAESQWAAAEKALEKIPQSDPSLTVVMNQAIQYCQSRIHQQNQPSK
jgi:hypothetical protein